MTRAAIFLVVVLAAYALLLIRARGKRINGKRIIKSVESGAAKVKHEAESLAAKTTAFELIARPTARPDAIDFITPVIESVRNKIDSFGEAPIMREKINEGSEKFFEAEELRRRDALRGNREPFRLPGEPPPSVPDDLDLARDLWPKPRGDKAKGGNDEGN